MDSAVNTDRDSDEIGEKHCCDGQCHCRADISFNDSSHRHGKREGITEITLEDDPAEPALKLDEKRLVQGICPALCVNFFLVDPFTRRKHPTDVVGHKVSWRKCDDKKYSKGDQKDC